MSLHLFYDHRACVSCQGNRSSGVLLAGVELELPFMPSDGAIDGESFMFKVDVSDLETVDLASSKSEVARN